MNAIESASSEAMNPIIIDSARGRHRQKGPLRWARVPAKTCDVGNAKGAQAFRRPGPGTPSIAIPSQMEKAVPGWPAGAAAQKDAQYIC